MIQIQSPT